MSLRLALANRSQAFGLEGKGGPVAARTDARRQLALLVGRSRNEGKVLEIRLDDFAVRESGLGFQRLAAAEGPAGEKGVVEVERDAVAASYDFLFGENVLAADTNFFH